VHRERSRQCGSVRQAGSIRFRRTLRPDPYRWVAASVFRAAHGCGCAGPRRPNFCLLVLKAASAGSGEGLNRVAITAERRGVNLAVHTHVNHVSVPSSSTAVVAVA
jgi:hypothetical protein